MLYNTGDVKAIYDYYPFGLSLRSIVTDEDARYKFTGKELDKEGELDWYYFGARYYDPEIGRWLSVDPLAHEYPSHSPYNYVLNNPINYFDPDGREVFFETEEEAEAAAAALNEVNEGSGITVESETEEHSFLGLFSWTTTTYKLSTAGSTFDWGQNKYTSGLFDCINSKEINFNISLVDGDKTGWPITLNEGGGGEANSYEGGSDILISNTENRVGDPMGVVIMHELVGHGHPSGGTSAHAVNRFYQQKLKYKREPYGIAHPGYHTVIGWEKTGLYKGKK